jgi:biotin carboxyl carrier protein
MNEFVSRSDKSKYIIQFSDDNYVSVNNSQIEYSIKKISSTNYVVSIKNKSFLCSIIENKNSFFEINVNGSLIKIYTHSLFADKAEELIKEKNISNSAGMIVRAPMPGMILKIKKKDGETVERGETVLILEAMKMENEIRAPIGGKVHFNSINEGTSIEKNVKLFEIK